MKYLCVFVVIAMCAASCLAAIADSVEAVQDAAAVKKTEKRGIYGFGYGHGYGGFGHGGHYSGYGFGSPYYGGYSIHHAPYYGGHAGYYPYHHGHYGFY